MKIDSIVNYLQQHKINNEVVSNITTLEDGMVRISNSNVHVQVGKK